MAEFDLGKSIDEIQQKAALLEPEWYKVRLVKEVKKEPNKVKKNGGTAENGARDNLVLTLRVVSADPSINGRPFTKWLSMPNHVDFEQFDEYAGIPKGDRMLGNAIKWATAFGNDCSDGKLHFEAGQEAFVYIIQEYDNRVESPTEDDLRNAIDMNTVPRTVAEME
jgi:hypothetical protein